MRIELKLVVPTVLTGTYKIGSIHEVIEPPEKYKKTKQKGIWIIGDDDKTPVRILNEEYEVVEY